MRYLKHLIINIAALSIMACSVEYSQPLAGQLRDGDGIYQCDKGDESYRFDTRDAQSKIYRGGQRAHLTFVDLNTDELTTMYLTRTVDAKAGAPHYQCNKLGHPLSDKAPI